MSEAHDAVEVVVAKRDHGRAERLPDRLGGRRLHPRRGRRGADVRPRDGDPAQRHGPPRDLPVDRRDDRLRGADGLLVPVPADGGQALDGRGGGQGHPSAGPARRGVRGRGAPAVRAGARPHGGTLDKLEAIPGWRADLTTGRCSTSSTSRRCGRVRRRMRGWLRRTGSSTRCGTSPAPSRPIPLIASSIMSKKIAEGTGALVLDVKVGSGAFMKDVASRRGSWRRRWSGWAVTRGSHRRAAHRHVHAAGADGGQRAGGRRVGRGARRRRPRRRRRADAGPRPRDAGRGGGARRRPGRAAGRRLRDGRVAPDDRRAGRRPGRCAPAGPRDAHGDGRAQRGLTRLDAMAVGLAAWRLGAGRARKEDRVQAGAGVVMHAKPGDP